MHLAIPGSPSTCMALGSASTLLNIEELQADFNVLFMAEILPGAPPAAQGVLTALQRC
jgi:hypothetical protein